MEFVRIFFTFLLEKNKTKKKLKKKKSLNCLFPEIQTVKWPFKLSLENKLFLFLQGLQEFQLRWFFWQKFQMTLQLNSTWLIWGWEFIFLLTPGWTHAVCFEARQRSWQWTSCWTQYWFFHKAFNKGPGANGHSGKAHRRGQHAQVPRNVPFRLKSSLRIEI